MSSANTFKLDWSQNLSFSEELNVAVKITCNVEQVENIVENGENAGYPVSITERFHV